MNSSFLLSAQRVTGVCYKEFTVRHYSIRVTVMSGWEIRVEQDREVTRSNIRATGIASSGRERPLSGKGQS
jgi:hypothetical protein